MDQGDIETVRRPLVGRDRDLQALSAFLANAFQHGGALMLAGEPGVGKTALLDAAVRLACDAEARIVRTVGQEFLTDLGFAALARIILPLRSALTRLDMHDREALDVVLDHAKGRAVGRMALANAALALFRHAAHDAPLVVIIDDFQWLDRPSADVLGMVARRLSGSHVALLGAYRTGCRHFAELGGVAERNVAPLDEASAYRLMNESAPDLQSEVRRRILQEAAGNPLALLELPAALDAEWNRGTDRMTGSIPLTERLLDLYASRIRHLPVQTRQILLVKALAGTHGPAAERGTAQATQAARVQKITEVQHLLPAQEAGLVRVDRLSGCVTFRHPLIRSAMVQLSTAKEVSEAHAVLANLWDDDPDRRAWHLAQATSVPDEGVAALVELAAHGMLRRGDAVGAISALSKAAELSPQMHDRSRRIAYAAYVGADVTGSLDQVEHLLRDARKSDPASDSGLQAAVAAAVLLLNGEGDVVTAHRLLVGAIEVHMAAGGAQDEPLHEALHTLMMVCWFGGEAELWTSFYAALARLSEVPRPLALAARTFADPVYRGRDALPGLDSAISDLTEENDPTKIVRTGFAAFYVHRLAGCHPAFWRVVRDGRNGGAIASAINVLLIMGAEGFFTGQWEQAEELLDEGLHLADRYGYQLLSWPGVYAKALIATARGDHTKALDLAEEIAAFAAPRGVRALLHYTSHIRVLVSLARGDFAQAYAHACAVSPAGTLPPFRPHALWLALDLVEAAVGAGLGEAARAHACALEKVDIAALSPRLALIQFGTAAISEPDDDIAFALFEQAFTGPAADRWPFDAARVRLSYGERLRRAGRDEDATAALMAALDGFQRLGAHPWAARAGRALRALGYQQPVSSGSTADDEPGPALTEREMEIAVLAAQGLRNKEIAELLVVSPRTVGNCLYRIFPKLGITTRAGLRDALSGLMPSPPLRD